MIFLERQDVRRQEETPLAGSGGEPAAERPAGAL